MSTAERTKPPTCGAMSNGGVTCNLYVNHISKYHYNTKKAKYWDLEGNYIPFKVGFTQYSDLNSKGDSK